MSDHRNETEGKRHLDRRGFLRLAGAAGLMLGAGGLLQGCTSTTTGGGAGGAPAPTKAAAPAPTTAAAAPAPTTAAAAPTKPAAAATTAPAAASGQKEILLGILVGLTGGVAPWGTRTSYGMLMGIDKVNAAGGIKSLGGAKLKAVMADTQSKPDVAVQQAQSLISQGVLVITGCNQSASSVVASQVIEQAGVAFISASDTDPLLTSRGFKNIFRLNPTIAQNAKDFIQFVVDMGKETGKPAKTLAILTENSILGKSAGDGLDKYAKAAGLTVVDRQEYQPSTGYDFTSALAKIKEKNADVVAGHRQVADAVSIARAMKQLNYSPMVPGAIIGGESGVEFTGTLGKDSDFIFGATAYSGRVDIPGLADFRKAYETQYKEALDDNPITGTNFVAVVVDALERAGSTDRKAFRDAVAKTKLPAGGMFLHPGGVEFDENGDNKGNVSVVYQIKDNDWHIVWPKEYAEKDFKVTYPFPGWNR